MIKTGTVAAMPDARIKPGRDATHITAERMAEIARQQEKIRQFSPQLFEDAKNFKEVFGYCRVLNARPLEGVK